MASLLVGAALAACVLLALRKIRRDRLLTSCGGDCAGCAMGCKREEKPRGARRGGGEKTDS